MFSGLYDPTLGPVSQHGLPCPTCGMLYVNCPGHPGHIELCVPVCIHSRHILTIKIQIFCCRYINPCCSQICLHCFAFSVRTVIGNHVITFPANHVVNDFHRFRSPVNKVRMVLIRLKLLDMGLVKESDDIELLCQPQTLFPEDAAEFRARAEATMEKYERMFETHAKSRQSLPDSRTKKMQRDIITDFYKTSLTCRSCSSCGSFSPALRKDGHCKIFEKPLAKRQRKSMQGMRINLKVSHIVNLSQSGR